MNILIISKCPTHPINAGNRKGILNQVDALKELGHNVYFLYIKENSVRDRAIDDDEPMVRYWGNNLYCMKLTALEHLYQSLLHRIRIVFNNGYCKVDDYYPRRLTRFVKNIIKETEFGACIVNYYYLSKLFETVHFDHEAIFTHDYFAYKGLLVGNKTVGYNTTADEEAKALQRVPSVFSVNTEETHYFQRLSPNSKIYNIFSRYIYTPSPIVGNRNLLYLSGDNQYNINGVKWFLTKIWPLLLDKFPDINLLIGGAICKKLLDIKSDNVKLYGFVDDPIDFFNQGDVVINPTYQGTGLKIKTFEGMSYDKVLMAHPHSLEGVFNPDNAPVFTSVNAYEWVNFLSEIFKDDDKILKIKIQNKLYFEEMNNYIRNEYVQFLS